MRGIGVEPPGATPLEEEELEGLIPDFVATRADLNQVEYENITAALPWARRQAEQLGPNGILDYGFLLAVHRRMFGDVWTWAGTLRQRVTNIGVDPSQIALQTLQAFEDARHWHSASLFESDERAARIHHRLVTVHPFPNGNGRCTRLIADLYLMSIELEPFTWGPVSLDTEGSQRAAYIAALVKASTTSNFADLIRFARG
jgi:Fic-DOC domain mobile mystery protein B